MPAIAKIEKLWYKEIMISRIFGFKKFS